MVPYLFASIPQSVRSVDRSFSSVGENAHSPPPPLHNPQLSLTFYFISTITITCHNLNRHIVIWKVMSVLLKSSVYNLEACRMKLQEYFSFWNIKCWITELSVPLEIMLCLCLYIDPDCITHHCPFHARIPS